jgi:hypothetical protein
MRAWPSSTQGGGKAKNKQSQSNQSKQQTNQPGKQQPNQAKPSQAKPSQTPHNAPTPFLPATLQYVYNRENVCRSCVGYSPKAHRKCLKSARANTTTNTKRGAMSNAIQGRAALLSLLFALAAPVAAPAWAENVSGIARQYNLPTPVTGIASQIFDLHTLLLVICLLIFVAVFGVMFYSIFAHRKSKGVKPATFHDLSLIHI